MMGLVTLSHPSKLTLEREDLRVEVAYYKVFAMAVSFSEVRMHVLRLIFWRQMKPESPLKMCVQPFTLRKEFP